MTHVLLDNSLAYHLEIRNRLRRWGMTIGALDRQSPGFVWPHIQECDLVILAPESVPNTGRNIHSGDAEPSVPLAPVLLLGVSDPLLLDRDAWQGLLEPNPESQQLRQAVQVGLEQTEMLRHGTGSGEDREDFLTFLGHEMRSPLTAAKTALEVLQGDLGGLHNPDAEPDPSLKMVEVALRNVRRLHHTLEWSQELLSASNCGQNNPLQDLKAEQLQEFLGSTYSLYWGNIPHGILVHTDLEDLAQLLEQAGRALHYAMPGCTLELTVDCSGGELDTLELVLQPNFSADQSETPRVARHGLIQGCSGENSKAAELRRLVLFVVSESLVSHLDLTLDVLDRQPDEPGIQMRIPLALKTTRGEDSVTRLLPTV